MDIEDDAVEAVLQVAAPFLDRRDLLVLANQATEEGRIPDADALLQRLRSQADELGRVQLTLQPLPANAHDPNAIAVHLPPAAGGGRVGFLPRETAAWVAPLWRAHLFGFECVAHHLATR